MCIRDRNDAWIAHAVGLLHDTARFSQYRDYQTFQDSASFDHGDRGAETVSYTHLDSTTSRFASLNLQFGRNYDPTSRR